MHSALRALNYFRSKYLRRHSARESFPRWLANNDSTSHHSRGTCHAGNCDNKNCFSVSPATCVVANTHATIVSPRLASELGTPNTTHSRTPGWANRTFSIL